MKKKILIIILVIIIFICSLFLVANKLKKENNNDNKGNDNQIKSYEVIDENANEDYKTLLKIQYWEDTYIESPETEVQTINSNYIVDTNKYVETLIKTYENDSKVEELVTIIKNDFNIIISNKWKYYIHYFDKDKKFGTITFIYYINNIIGTNRAIHFYIADGIIDEISYSYLNEYLNEEELLYSYNYFINHFIQERGVIDRFKNYYTIVKDDFHYNYNFKNKKLKYTYQIFYRYPAGAIDNDWGTETYIEPKLIENLIKTKKIVVKDDSNKEVNTISDQKDITKITELLSRTIPIKNNKNIENNNWNLSLYDENNELINTININKDGTLGIDNTKNEYLKEQYFNELTKLLKQ